MRMLRKIAFTLALSLVVASHAEASPIELVLAVTYYAPVIGPTETGFDYLFFQSATNDYPGAPIPYARGLFGHGPLLPGVNRFLVSLDVPDVSQSYFLASGSYGFIANPGPGNPHENIFIAQPPSPPAGPGGVPSEIAYRYGPPWIPLANLGSGLSGRLEHIAGEWPTFGGGSWEVVPAPEPTSILLFGTGLAAAVRLRRRKRAGK